MLGLIDSFVIGVCIGSVGGTCIGLISIIVKHYIDSKNHEIDVKNITNNILHISDEEKGSTLDYMTARPII